MKTTSVDPKNGACNQCSHTSSQEQKGTFTWGLMLCGHHLDILHNFAFEFVSEVKWDNVAYARGLEPLLTCVPPSVSLFSSQGADEAPGTYEGLHSPVIIPMLERTQH